MNSPTRTNRFEVAEVLRYVDRAGMEPYGSTEAVVEARMKGFVRTIGTETEVTEAGSAWLKGYEKGMV